MMHYMTTCSENPVLPNRTHPVFPESLTATIKALSPFRRAPIGFPGLAIGLVRCIPSSDNARDQSPSDSVESGTFRLLLGRLSYCGPSFLIGNFGSSGNSSNTCDSWEIVGNRTSRALMMSFVVKEGWHSLDDCYNIFWFLSRYAQVAASVPTNFGPGCGRLPDVPERQVRIGFQQVVCGIAERGE